MKPADHPAGGLIRSAHPQDLETLVSIEIQAFEPPAHRPWKRHELAAEIGPRQDRLFLVVTCDDGAALGYCLFQILDHEAELLRMAVAPQARRRGLGRALLAAALEELEGGAPRQAPALEKIQHCLLEVRADNQPAIALYRSFGFGLEGRRARYYPDGVDALLFRREIQAEHA